MHCVDTSPKVGHSAATWVSILPSWRFHSINPLTIILKIILGKGGGRGKEGRENDVMLQNIQRPWCRRRTEFHSGPCITWCEISNGETYCVIRQCWVNKTGMDLHRFVPKVIPNNSGYTQQFLIEISALHVFVWSEDHSGLFSGAHLQLESLLFRYFQPWTHGNVWVIHSGFIKQKTGGSL